MKETETSTKRSVVGQFAQVKPIHYAHGIAEMVKQMNKDGIKCELSRHDNTGIYLAVYGVTIGDDGKFVEVENVTN